SYTEFLALLLQDELARRENNKLFRRVRYAGVNADKTVERLDLTRAPSLNAALVADLATCRFVEEHAPVLIAGLCGTGKSHLAQALAHCALRPGHEVLFTTQSKLLGKLHAARATNSYDKRLQALAPIP